MRRFILGFAISVIASIIILACQKEESSKANTDTNFDGKAAKEWYYGTNKKSAEWQGSIEKGKKMPDWENGTYHKVGDMEIVEFPLIKQKQSFELINKEALSASDKRKVIGSALSRIIFLKDKASNILVREIHYVPDMDYLARHNFDISSNTIGAIDKDFSGVIVARAWGGLEISRKILKNGKITAGFKRSLNISGSLTESCPIGSTEVIEYYRDCESHLYGDGMFTYECDEWTPTGTVFCVPGEEIDDFPECVDPNSAQCSCTLIGNCEDPGGDDPTCLSTCLTNFNELIDGQVANEIDVIEIVDVNGITKHKNPRWKIFNSATFKLYSQEQGVVKLINVQNDIWQWESLTHGPISKTGLAVGGTITYTQGVGTPTFVAGTQNILYAGMSVNFDITYAAVCNCPIVSDIIPPVTRNYTANSIWDAHP